MFLPNLPIPLSYLCHITGRKPAFFYHLLNTGRLKTHKCEGMIMIDPVELKRMIDAGMIKLNENKIKSRIAAY